MKTQLKQTKKKHNKTKNSNFSSKSTNQKITFVNQGLFDQDLNLVIKKCSNNKKAKILNVSQNNLTNKGFEYLIEQL